MNDIIEKYNDLRESIELADDLDPSLKDELMSKLDDLDGLIDEIMDCKYEDDEFNDVIDNE